MPLEPHSCALALMENHLTNVFGCCVLVPVLRLPRVRVLAALGMQQVVLCQPIQKVSSALYSMMQPQVLIDSLLFGTAVPIRPRHPARPSTHGRSCPGPPLLPLLPQATVRAPSRSWCDALPLPCPL